MSEKEPISVSAINIPDLPDCIDNAITNLTDAPTKGIGQTLGDLWFLVFGKISQAAEKKKIKYAIDLEKFHQQLTQKVDSIPSNKQIEPSIQVAAQALENSRYCISDETLREMFANLISGTMNVDTASFAHPAFPEILKQLSSQDALVLQHFYRSGAEALPIVSIQCQDTNGGYYILYDNLFLIKNLEYSSDAISLSLASLQRTNLIAIDYSKSLADDSMYLPFAHTPEYESARKLCALPDYKNIYLKKGAVQLTSFGKAFCSICVK